MRRKSDHLATTPRLYDAGGDLSKDWMVRYQFRNPLTGTMQTVRILRGLSKIRPELLRVMKPAQKEILRQERYKTANAIMAAELEKIKSGGNPLLNETRIYASDVAQPRRKKSKPIEDYISEALISHCVGLEPASVKSYKKYVKNFFEWLAATQYNTLPISGITERHAEDFLNWTITEKEGSNKYRNEHLNLIRKLFQRVIKTNPRIISHNPFSNCEKKKHTRKKNPIYTDQMRERVRRYLPDFDPQLWLFVQFVYYTALRPHGELRMVQIKEIDLAQGLLLVPADKAKDDEDRTITLPHQLLIQLEMMMVENYPGEYYLFSNDEKPGEKPVRDGYFVERWQIFRNKFGIPDSFKIYSFKHTGATAADNSGIDRRELQRHLGHSSLQQTEEYLELHKNKVNERIRDRFPTF